MKAELKTMLHEHLREILSYDPNTGVFTWMVRRKKIRIGGVAGGIDGGGYRRIMIDGRNYLASRLAWFYMTGVWPLGEIDHKNVVRDDNRWCNLREATSSQNHANMKKASTNTSGFKGVRWGAFHGGKHGAWRAVIRANGKHVSLGHFATREAAAATYAAAAAKYFGDFARFA